MAKLQYTQAFAAYGAKLANPQWSYSAIASDGALVVSCWAHKLKLIAGKLHYIDKLSRWKPNPPGKNLLVEHLTLALTENKPVRLIIVTTTEPDVVDRGEDASAIPKTFHIRQDVVGRVVNFDGDNFEFEFQHRDT
ncbi:MAG: hypothetical protein QM533_01995 [Cytophagales bacterium]|nr:hypothetical protein [Cytophagales bacterium]